MPTAGLGGGRADSDVKVVVGRGRAAPGRKAADGRVVKGLEFLAGGLFTHDLRDKARLVLLPAEVVSVGGDELCVGRIGACGPLDDLEGLVDDKLCKLGLGELVEDGF